MFSFVSCLLGRKKHMTKPSDEKGFLVGVELYLWNEMLDRTVCWCENKPIKNVISFPAPWLSVLQTILLLLVQLMKLARGIQVVLYHVVLQQMHILLSRNRIHNLVRSQSLHLKRRRKKKLFVDNYGDYQR